MITSEYETEKYLEDSKTLHKLNLAKDEISFQSFFATYVKLYVTESKMSHWWTSIYNWSIHCTAMAVKSTPSCSEYSAKTKRDVFLQMRSSKFTVCLLFVLVLYCSVIVLVPLYLYCILFVFISTSRVLFSSSMSGSFNFLVNTFSFPFTRALKHFRTFYRGLNWMHFFLLLFS